MIYSDEVDRLKEDAHELAVRMSIVLSLIQTLAAAAILSKHQVLSNERAGYFIHDWQELRDQVRKMIMNEARYKAIKELRK